MGGAGPPPGTASRRAPSAGPWDRERPKGSWGPGRDSCRGAQGEVAPPPAGVAQRPKAHPPPPGRRPPGRLGTVSASRLGAGLVGRQARPRALASSARRPRGVWAPGTPETGRGAVTPAAALAAPLGEACRAGGASHPPRASEPGTCARAPRQRACPCVCDTAPAKCAGTSQLVPRHLLAAPRGRRASGVRLGFPSASAADGQRPGTGPSSPREPCARGGAGGPRAARAAEPRAGAFEGALEEVRRRGGCCRRPATGRGLGSGRDAQAAPGSRGTPRSPPSPVSGDFASRQARASHGSLGSVLPVPRGSWGRLHVKDWGGAPSTHPTPFSGPSPPVGTPVPNWLREPADTGSDTRSLRPHRPWSSVGSRSQP